MFPASSENVLVPRVMTELLPSRPLLTSPEGDWRDIGLQLQMYRHPPASVWHPGTHDHLLVLNMDGNALLDDTSLGFRQTGWARGGSFSLTPAGLPVSRPRKGKPEILLISLDPKLIDDIVEEMDLDRASVKIIPQLAVSDQALHSFGQALRAEAATGGFGSTLMVESVFRSLCVHLLRHYSSLAAKPLPRPTLTSRRLTNVLEYMKAHLDQPLLLSELAEICGLSPTHFNRAFRDALGKPPHAYLIELRLEKAKDLLEHTRLPITQIALSCGFEQSQYFATLFRRKVGFTPREWRIERGI